MNTQSLSTALRNHAAAVMNVNVETEQEHETLRDAAELLRVLARIVDGATLKKSFGPPGDWGYETMIGTALAEAPMINDRPAWREKAILLHPNLEKDIEALPPEQ